MKIRLKITIFLAAALCLGCQALSAQNIDLEKTALEKLYKMVNEDTDRSARLRNGEIYLGQKRIKVSSSVEHDQSQGDAYIFAVRFDTTFVDTNPEVITISSIGIGKDKKDAMEASVDEWVNYFGKALSRMLAAYDTNLREGLGFYPGFMGVRGKLPSKTWLDGTWEMNRKLIEVINPVVKKEKRNLISVNLMIVVEKGGAVGGECTINNVVSQELMDELKKMEWKAGPETYLFKQSFMIKRTESAKPTEKK